MIFSMLQSKKFNFMFSLMWRGTSKGATTKFTSPILCFLDPLCTKSIYGGGIPYKVEAILYPLNIEPGSTACNNFTNKNSFQFFL